MLTGKIKREKKKFETAIQEQTAFAPLFIKLKLMWDCNLRCQMCNHWRSNSPSLPVHFFQDVVQQVADLGCRRIHISGGEPLLYDDLYALLKTIKNEKIRLSMTTNATLIKEQTAHDLVMLGLNQVNVSIDSPIPEIHDEVRGIEGSFNRTVRGLQYIRQAMPDGNIQINMVLNPFNFRSLKLLPDLVHELGANRICLIPLKVHTPDLRYFSLDEIKEFNEEIAPEVWEKGSSLGLFTTKDQVFIFGTTDEDLLMSSFGKYARHYYETHPCFALWTHALIDHDGMVSACCFATRNPVIGDLKKDSFKTIWNSEAYNQLRNKQHAPLEACHSCTMFIPKNQEIDHFLEVKENKNWLGSFWGKFKNI